MIRNTTSNALLAKRAVPVKGFFRQGFGLMFRKPLHDEGWVFLLPRSSRWDITNWFVFFPITVVWLSDESRVLKVAQVPSFKFRVPGVLGTCTLIELSANCSKLIQEGDHISWSFSAKDKAI